MAADRSLPYLHGLLDGLVARLRRRSAVRAALWAATAALAGLAVLVVLVAAIGLPAVVLLVGALAGAAAVGVAWTVAYRPRPSAVYVARLVEGRRPDLKNALVTLVELMADPSSDRSMQAALARRAARIVSRDPPDALLTLPDTRRPGWAAAGSAVLLGATLWLGQGTAVAPWVTTAEARVDTGAPAPRLPPGASYENTPEAPSDPRLAPGASHENTPEAPSDPRLPPGAGYENTPKAPSDPRLPPGASYNDTVAPPMALREPSTDVPEDVLDAMRRTKPATDVADDGPPGHDEDRLSLGRMGVSVADQRRYTTAWQERGGPAPRADTSSSSSPTRTVAGKASGAILEPTGEADARGAVLPAGKGADEPGGLIHAAASRVSPRLRPAVRAYFERLDRLRQVGDKRP